MLGTVDSRTILAFDRPDASEAVFRIAGPNDRAVLIPAPRISILPHSSDLHSDANWLVFCDPVAVRSLEFPDTTVGSIDDLRICAAGEMTAIELRDRAIHSDVVPGRSDPNAVVNAVLDYESPPLIRAVVFGPEEIANALADVLRSRGAGARAVATHTVSVSDTWLVARVKALLSAEAVDTVVLTEDDDVHFFKTLFFGALTKGMPAETAVLATPSSYRSALESGFSPRLESK